MRPDQVAALPSSAAAPIMEAVAEYEAQAIAEAALIVSPLEWRS